MPREDGEGKASVHQEKNWASSFPAAHTWVQAHSPKTNTTINLAGGKILGMTAYLYVSSGCKVPARWRNTALVAFCKAPPKGSVVICYLYIKDLPLTLYPPV
jgi:hypothetical protein